MKIYICIPSLNEARTISLVTRLVDKGLQDLSLFMRKTIDAKIINIDSASNDDTVNIFNSTDTVFPKQSIILEGSRGKGKNLLHFIKIAYQEKADFCLTIDADINSADSSWISELLNPLISNQADFVTPLYARSRFEGSSTNHFAYPIVLALTGIKARQPIAGDFAFNYSILDIIQNLEIPESANGYGIDIFLTLAAITSGLRHRQVSLGEKKHNPSFDKLEYMFPQIAASALSLLREVKIKKIKEIDDEAMVNNIASASLFQHRVAAEVMREHSISQLVSGNLTEWGWVPNGITKKDFNDSDIQINDWVSILSAWIKYGLENKNIKAEILAEQLLPFFVLRATNFWFSSENMTAEEVESQIREQAMLLCSSMRKL